MLPIWLVSEVNTELDTFLVGGFQTFLTTSHISGKRFDLPYFFSLYRDLFCLPSILHPIALFNEAVFLLTNKYTLKTPLNPDAVPEPPRSTFPTLPVVLASCFWAHSSIGLRCSKWAPVGASVASSGASVMYR